MPGSRPELFAKALAGEADALSFDREDAVAEDRKAEARAAVADVVAGEVVTQAAKLIIVRTNAPDSPHFALDLAAIVRSGVTLINLLKIESPCSPPWPRSPRCRPVCSRWTAPTSRSTTTRIL